MIQGCFSQPGSPSSISQVPQNLVTCTYQTQLCNSPTYLTLSWSSTLFSRSLLLCSADIFSITVSLNPSTFSLFKTRPGSKSIYLSQPHQRVRKIKLFWDFSRANYNHNSAEPESCFYLAVVRDGKLEFFLGDLFDDLTRRSNRLITTHKPPEPVLLSRREHVFGSRSYKSLAQFLGSKHEIEIECDEGVLKVKVDGQTSLVVKRLSWKFRGNERILIDGIEVEFFWDVFSWVNSNNGHGVFVFQVGDGGVLPEMVGPEKKLMRKSLPSGATTAPSMTSLSASPSSSSVLQWTEESSDGGRSSCSSSTKSCGSNGGFSLLLYAWSRD
ncbi:uncharacterized protein LOC114740513 [Neltuma alba]|uniref:uncharacterized protein LOC114728077 n=1 Tax=Neltuma alba TaxID=207710 RepID=UPI0010A339B4|nr:uncharacterized protein LOC114728077 [Prosopis alba]XP_028784505.1 uncharacterized protein LOC114740513 [Prosopis alba]